MMAYNGTELPALPTLNDYGFAAIDVDGFGYYRLLFSETPLYITLSSSGDKLCLNLEKPCAVYSYELGRYDDWSLTTTNAGGSFFMNSRTLVWSNHDVINRIDNSVYLPASVPVPVGDSSVTAGMITIETIHAGDDFMSSAVSVSGLGSTDSIYNFRAYLYENGVPLDYVDSDAFAGPFMYWHLTKSNLTPETEYTLQYVLLENGEETSVTASQSFTTLASANTPTVDDTQTLSLLSAILAAINDQNDRQENEYESIVDILGMLWLRLRYIEENTLALSKEETALKEATKETTQAVVDEVFAEDAPTKVTVSDVKDVAEIGSAASSMFDSGVSIGSFFDALNNIRFIAFFSQETYDDLNTVQSISTYSRDNESGYVDYYSENLDKIQKFVGGD